MEIEQWPLTAAATQALLALPAHDAKRGSAPPPPGDAVKLALKELLLRGAYRIEIEKRRFGKQRVELIPMQIPELPRALAGFDELLRPHAPGEIGAVVKAARKANAKLVVDAGESFLGELSERGLAVGRREKSLGLFPVTRWRRTPSGDAWAGAAAEHVTRLEALAVGGTDAESTARVAAEAGAVAVMVPRGPPRAGAEREAVATGAGRLDALRLRRRRRWNGVRPRQGRGRALRLGPRRHRCELRRRRGGARLRRRLDRHRGRLGRRCRRRRWWGRRRRGRRRRRRRELLAR